MHNGLSTAWQTDMCTCIRMLQYLQSAGIGSNPVSMWVDSKANRRFNFMLLVVSRAYTARPVLVLNGFLICILIL